MVTATDEFIVTESLLLFVSCKPYLIPTVGRSGKYRVPVLGLYALVGWRRIYLLAYLANMCCNNILLVMALCICVCVNMFMYMYGWWRVFRTRSDRPWGPTSHLYNEYRVCPECKTAGAWCFPPTPCSAEVKERVEIYHYSPPDFRGMF